MRRPRPLFAEGLSPANHSLARHFFRPASRPTKGRTHGPRRSGTRGPCVRMRRMLRDVVVELLAPFVCAFARMTDGGSNPFRPSIFFCPRADCGPHALKRQTHGPGSVAVRSRGEEVARCLRVGNSFRALRLLRRASAMCRRSYGRGSRRPNDSRVAQKKSRPRGSPRRGRRPHKSRTARTLQRPRDAGLVSARCQMLGGGCEMWSVRCLLSADGLAGAARACCPFLASTRRERAGLFPAGHFFCQPPPEHIGLAHMPPGG